MTVLCEWTALAQLKNRRFEDSVKSLLRGLHYDPGCLRLWFNVAVVRSESAIAIMKKTSRTVADIRFAIDDVNASLQLFKYLGSSNAQYRGLQFERDQSGKNERYLEVI